MRSSHRSFTWRHVAVGIATLSLACSAPDTNQDAGAAQAVSADAPAARLPADFPENFPLVADFVIVEAQFTEGSTMTQANFLVRGTSAMSPVEIATFYHDQLPAVGFRVQGDPPAAASDNALVYFQSEEYQNCSVQLSAAGDRTSLLISLPLRD